MMNLIPKSFYLDDLFDDLGMKNTSMKCDIYEKNGDYNIEMEIPGFEKKDIGIDYDKGYLTITAEKESKNEEEEKNYIRRERSYGKYQRTFYLGDIDSENIKAEFNHGMLKIIIPKSAEIETKKHIEIGE